MRRVLFCSIFALMAATAVGAQVAAKPGDTKAVTLAGCLGGGASQFVLTNVTAAAAKAGEKNAAAPSGLAESYDLVSSQGVSLAPHVGHRVELTGVISEAVSGDAKAPRKGEQDPVTRARAPREPLPRFTVSSLKRVSPICLQ